MLPLLLRYRLLGLDELFGIVYGAHYVVVAGLLHHLVLRMNTVWSLLMTFRRLVTHPINVTVLVIYETALVNLAPIWLSVYRWGSTISFC